MAFRSDPRDRSSTTQDTELCSSTWLSISKVLTTQHSQGLSWSSKIWWGTDDQCMPVFAWSWPAVLSQPCDLLPLRHGLDQNKASSSSSRHGSPPGLGLEQPVRHSSMDHRTRARVAMPVWVVVLGDFGRSPRMQNHTTSLAQQVSGSPQLLTSCLLPTSLPGWNRILLVPALETSGKGCCVAGRSRRARAGLYHHEPAKVLSGPQYHFALTGTSVSTDLLCALPVEMASTRSNTYGISMHCMANVLSSKHRLSCWCNTVPWALLVCMWGRNCCLLTLQTWLENAFAQASGHVATVIFCRSSIRSSPAI